MGGEYSLLGKPEEQRIVRSKIVDHHGTTVVKRDQIAVCLHCGLSWEVVEKERQARLLEQKG